MLMELRKEKNSMIIKIIDYSENWLWSILFSPYKNCVILFRWGLFKNCFYEILWMIVNKKIWYNFTFNRSNDLAITHDNNERWERIVGKNIESQLEHEDHFRKN